MELFNTLALCATLLASPPVIDASNPVNKNQCNEAYQEYKNLLKNIRVTPIERQAIAMVAHAEAANQGDAGLAGVVYTILNRSMQGKFGEGIIGVINKPWQFEPVQKAGGWENLPNVTPEFSARIDTIINLALDGYLPDLTHGSLFFQNPAIVSKRELAGEVSKGLTDFGGSVPVVTIRDHSWYSRFIPEHKEVHMPDITNEETGGDCLSLDIFARNQGATSADIFNRSGQDG